VEVWLEWQKAAFDRSERRLLAAARKSSENESGPTITAHLRPINGLRKQGKRFVN